MSSIESDHDSNGPTPTQTQRKVSIRVEDTQQLQQSSSSSSSSSQSQSYHFMLKRATKSFKTKAAYSQTIIDPVMAERRRRKNLNQQFIAISTLVPRLKKMDKASILEEAINHLKELQERVDLLENTEKSEGSVVFTKKIRLLADKDTSCCDEQSEIQKLPEIEARVEENQILIRIHCEKHKGIVVKAMREIEDLHLLILSSSVLPFGDYFLDITIVAKMGDEFGMAVEDVKKSLREALIRFMG